MSIDDNSHSKPTDFLTGVWSLVVFVVFASVVVISIRNNSPVDLVEQQRAEDRVKHRVAAEKSVDERLKLGWENKAKGTIRLPIVDAKRLLLADLQAKPKGPVASTVKVEPPMPPAAPYDPKSKEPAAPALPSSPQGADTIRFEAPVLPASPSALVQPTHADLNAALSVQTS
jgi:hypothetical protein